MFDWLKKMLAQTDWFLITTIIFLSIFGLLAIYSVALGRGTNELASFQKQLVWLLVGIPFCLVVSLIDYRLFKNFAWWGYGLSIFLLILVLTPLGSTINGARGWFDLGPASFQPVELTKIFLIFVLADLCARYSRNLFRLKDIIFMGVVVLLPMLLAMVQPDFGSAMVLFFIWLVAFLLVVRKRWQVILVFATIASLLLGAWFFVFEDYQKERIMVFLDSGRDPRGRGYNVRQSIIAVGAGKFLGRGLGFGSQSQLKFIPESQTDFIFAVIAEEIGFVGVFLLLTLFALMFYRFYKSAIRAPDDFGLFVVLLTSALLFFHILINIGMCIGLLPVTGISLPLVSYGGSFLLSILFLIGLIINIGRYGSIIRG